VRGILQDVFFMQLFPGVRLYQILYNYRGKIGLQIVYKMVYCQMDGIRKKLYWEMNMVHTPLVRKKR